MKIIIADDHVLFRETLKEYIERNTPKVKISFSSDLHGVLDILKKDPRQDLVLLDLRMPGMSGIEGFKILRREYPHIKAALMSGLAEPEDVRNALDEGAVGYFPKTMNSKGLLAGISDVLNGKIFVPVDKKTNVVMKSYNNGSESEHNKPLEYITASDITLSNREQDVLSCLMRGSTNKTIAHDLGIKEVTVKMHISSICQKLNVGNRTQAALKARELGLQIGA
jgi:DNA-binding NarL/FixJ family response regulator